MIIPKIQRMHKDQGKENEAAERNPLKVKSQVVILVERLIQDFDTFSSPNYRRQLESFYFNAGPKASGLSFGFLPAILGLSLVK